MTRLELGPNGGLIYCMEYLEKNVDWLIEKIDALGPKKYLLLDFPGQVRLMHAHGTETRFLSYIGLCVLDRMGCFVASTFAFAIFVVYSIFCPSCFQAELNTHSSAVHNVLRAHISCILLFG